MAVDDRRECRHTARVAVVDLSEHINAQAYRPEVLAARTKIRSFSNWSTLQGISRNVIRPGPHPKYVESGMPCAKTKNVDGVIADFTDVDHVPIAYFNGEKASHVVAGDILINVTGAGSIGRASVHLSGAPVLTNQHIVKVSTKPDVDAAYVAVFLNTWNGQRVIEHGISGSTGQLNIVNDRIRSVPVALPATDAQRYIGAKVRQADRLRTKARLSMDDMRAYFSLPQWTTPRMGAKRSYTADLQHLTDLRLDPSFYDPAHWDLLSALKSLHAHAVSHDSEDAAALKQGKFWYFEIGELDIGFGTIEPSLVAVEDAPSRAQIGVKPWDVLVSTVRPNRKNVAVVLPPDAKPGVPVLPMVASNGFAVLRFPSPESAVFHLGWMRSDAATQQLMQWNAGGAYPAIDSGIPSRILIPRYDPTEIATKGAEWKRGMEARDQSNRLIQAAKLLVEALIEGTLTESDLLAAAADPAADRALLARLTRAGLDIAGAAPLFPDAATLDALVADAHAQPAQG